MKSILVCTVAAASACALLISSAEAGGRHHGLGMSSSATSTGANSFPNGRSPLGEPVFLIPSTSSTNISGGPIGGYVPPRTPLPPLIAPNTNAAPLGGSSSASTSGVSNISTRTGRGTNVIFTPPPTIVGVPPSVTGTGNISGNNLAVDRAGGQGKFSTSILDTGLKLKTSNASPNLPQITAAQPDFIPSVVPVGAGPQGPPSIDHATTVTAAPAITTAPTGPTVQLGTTSSAASTSSSAANGH